MLSVHLGLPQNARPCHENCHTGGLRTIPKKTTRLAQEDALLRNTSCTPLESLEVCSTCCGGTLPT